MVAKEILVQGVFRLRMTPPEDFLARHETNLSR